ncbi:ABC-type polysaccharide transport system, permease component [Paenibacillus sp. JCM 10914]|nr:ABC-type polysaccharide transport system, permease component [Paenibacillus sp. JCM 10914]
MKAAELNRRGQQPTLGRIRKNWGLYLLLLPAVILVLLFSYVPMYGILIAFKDYSPAVGIMDSPWAGLKYFEKFFNSYQFSTTIINTLVISLYSVATFPIPIMLALMVNQMRQNWFKRVFQTVTYMPHFISTVVMVGLMLILFSPSSGLSVICSDSSAWKRQILWDRQACSAASMYGLTCGSMPGGTASSILRHCLRSIRACTKQLRWMEPAGGRRSDSSISRC